MLPAVLHGQECELPNSARSWNDQNVCRSALSLPGKRVPPGRMFILKLKNKYLNRLFTLQFGSTYLIIHLIFDYQLISVDRRLISAWRLISGCSQSERFERAALCELWI